MLRLLTIFWLKPWYLMASDQLYTNSKCSGQANF